MKEKIKLYPIAEQNEIIEKDFEVIENLELYVENLLTNNAKIITAQKDCKIEARWAQVGEVVDTRPRVSVDGKTYTFSETKREVSEDKANNVVVKNPDGEEYLLTREKFLERYVQDNYGNWISKGEPQQFIKINEDIIITPTNWGGDKQVVCAGSVINVTNKQDLYAITNLAFEKTYKTKEREAEQER